MNELFGPCVDLLMPIPQLESLILHDTARLSGAIADREQLVGLPGT